MPESKLVKIGADGAQLSLEDTEWQAVLDTRTGLMWTVEEHEVEHWKEAAPAAEAMTAGGFTDWRLPTVEELFLLADRARSRPAIDTDYFPDCRNDWYWTSTPAAPSPDCAWYVLFKYGDANWGTNNYSGFVRAVRPGQ